MAVGKSFQTVHRPAPKVDSVHLKPRWPRASRVWTVLFPLTFARFGCSGEPDDKILFLFVHPFIRNYSINELNETDICSYRSWWTDTAGNLPRRRHHSTGGKSSLWKDFLWRWGCLAERKRMATFIETWGRCGDRPKVLPCPYSDVLPNWWWINHL